MSTVFPTSSGEAPRELTLYLASHRPGPSSPPPPAACLSQTNMSTVLPMSSGEAPRKLCRLLQCHHGVAAEADVHGSNGLLPFKPREAFGVLLLSHRPLHLSVASSPMTLLRKHRRAVSMYLRMRVSLAKALACCYPLKGRAPPRKRLPADDRWSEKITTFC
uniref:Uncharacterized protein n=1 Tax=Oryza rufipogon TaxID=4529 RepID=A0A0E0QEU7_ORYRU